MSSKSIFIILIMAIMASIPGYNFVVIQPAEAEKLLLEKQLRQTIDKYNSANHAKNDLNNIREKLKFENEILDNIKSRFIIKNDLSSITFRMRDKTKENNLKLIDFTPVFKFFFADTSNAPVKSLPFSVTVSGKFIDIGRFIESWEKFDFYMVPDEIHIGNINSNNDDLEAVIVGRFYAWSKEQG